MKMKKGLLILCAVLLVAASVAGTIAYFTDSESVTNTFSVGKVYITLDEAPVDANGEATDGNRVAANTYKLIPGMEYDKDPTVHVEAGSENAYLFVKVVNGIDALEAAGDKDIETQIKANGWTPLAGVENVYYKNHTKAATETDYPVFDGFKIDGTKVVNAPATGETVPADKVSIAAAADVTVTAYAIQAAGFGTAADAWTAGNWA